jgi:hypothetical protein
MAAAATEMMEKLDEAGQRHRSAAEVFEAGTARLMRALSRYVYQLDRDGKPTPRN